jgi:hypothetical protein
MKVIRTLFSFGPLLFGIGFLAPLTAQCLVAVGLNSVTLRHAGLALNFNVPVLAIGLTMGGALGLAAKIKGRWL